MSYSFLRNFSIWSRRFFSSLDISPLGSLEPFQTSPFALSILSLALSASLPNLSKLAANSLAFFDAASPKSEMPSKPLLIASNPDLANLPTPGSFDNPNSNRRKGPEDIFIIASNNLATIGMIAANEFRAALAIVITALRNVSLLLNNLTIPATSSATAVINSPMGFVAITALKILS